MRSVFCPRRTPLIQFYVCSSHHMSLLPFPISISPINVHAHDHNKCSPSSPSCSRPPQRAYIIYFTMCHAAHIVQTVKKAAHCSVLARKHCHPIGRLDTNRYVHTFISIWSRFVWIFCSLALRLFPDLCNRLHGGWCCLVRPIWFFAGGKCAARPSLLLSAAVFYYRRLVWILVPLHLAHAMGLALVTQTKWTTATVMAAIMLQHICRVR